MVMYLFRYFEYDTLSHMHIFGLFIYRKFCNNIYRRNILAFWQWQREKKFQLRYKQAAAILNIIADDFAQF